MPGKVEKKDKKETVVPNVGEAAIPTWNPYLYNFSETNLSFYNCKASLTWVSHYMLLKSIPTTEVHGDFLWLTVRIFLERLVIQNLSQSLQ